MSETNKKVGIEIYEEDYYNLKDLRDSILKETDQKFIYSNELALYTISAIIKSVEDNFKDNRRCNE